VIQLANTGDLTDLSINKCDLINRNGDGTKEKKWALTLEAANICDLTNPHFQKWNLSSKQKW